MTFFLLGNEINIGNGCGSNISGNFLFINEDE